MMATSLCSQLKGYSAASKGAREKPVVEQVRSMYKSNITTTRGNRIVRALDTETPLRH